MKKHIPLLWIIFKVWWLATLPKQMAGFTAVVGAIWYWAPLGRTVWEWKGDLGANHHPNLFNECHVWVYGCIHCQSNPLKPRCWHKMIHWPATSGWDRQVESGRSSPPHIPHSTTYPFVPRIPSSHASTPAQRTLRPSNTWLTEVWKPLMCKAVNDIHLEQWKKRAFNGFLLGWVYLKIKVHSLPSQN